MNADSARLYFRAMSDEDLAKAQANLRKKAELARALDFADILASRDEPPSHAVEDQLDRNFDRNMKIAWLQKLVRDEVELRAEVSA